MAKERRQFSREFKLKALALMEAAANVEALAAELGIRRELLYVWRRKVEAGGAEALRNAGRPRPEAVSAEALSAERRAFVPTGLRIRSETFTRCPRRCGLRGKFPLLALLPSPGAPSDTPATMVDSPANGQKRPVHKGLSPT